MPETLFVRPPASFVMTKGVVHVLYKTHANHNDFTGISKLWRRWRWR